MKKRLLSIMMIILLVTGQILSGDILKANAIIQEFSVEIVVEGASGVLVAGTSTKSNAHDAIVDVLAKGNYSLLEEDSMYGKFIKGVKNEKTGEEITGINNSYWMYAVNRGGSYVDNLLGVSSTTLESGDRLILYNSGMNTMVPNRIEFSTKSPNKKLEISFNNFDSWTGAITKILDFKAKIDGNDVSINENKIVIDNGLKEGKHTLEFCDYNQSRTPNIIGDKIDFEIKRPSAFVRVEGLNGTIIEGSAEGLNALEILEKVLSEKNIEREICGEAGGKYIISINGLTQNRFKKYDGWMYYIKNNNGIFEPMLSIDGYIPNDGDDIIVYYGGWGITLPCNNIKFTPEVVKEKEEFKMKFSYFYNDYFTNQDVYSPIKGAIVNIDNFNYITDDNGEILVKGLSLGEHTYRISGYNVNDLPCTVMDKGVFKIDNINTPGFSHNDSNYDNLYNKDNTRITKDINKEILSTSSYVKGHQSSLWAAITLNKLGLKADEGYIRESAEEIKKIGVKSLSNTEIEKLIMCLSASGYNPYNFLGYNLVKELYDRDIKDFLINDYVFGLFTYEYANIKEEYKINKKTLVDSILSMMNTTKFKEKEIKGWSLFKNNVNPDITGATINALAPFYNEDSRVKNAVDNAVKSLSIMQTESGYIADSYGYSSESLSFVIMGLTSVGVNPEGVSFTKLKGDIVSGLLSFKGSEGAFKHSLDGKNDAIASEEALRAMIALKGYKSSGSYNFYKSSIDASKLPLYRYVANNTETKKESKKTNTSTKKNTSSSKEGIASDNATNSNDSKEVKAIWEDKTIINDTKEVINAISIAPDNAVIKIDASTNSIIDKSIFEGIKNTNKSIMIDKGNVIWSFRGTDITGEIKDIDLSLNDIPEYKNEIAEKYKDINAFVISFKNNGRLPGRAEFKIKLDEKWIEGKNNTDLYLYYYNPEKKEAERVEGPLVKDENGFVVMHIEHCSDYFISDSEQLTNLKKDTSNVAIISIAAVLVLASAGIFLLAIKRNK